jgi:hypothetical protein
MLKTIFLVLTFCISPRLYGQDFTDRVVLGEGYAKNQVRLVLKYNVPSPFSDTLIKIREEAIIAAEKVLFKKLGRKHITGQWPYEIYLIEGYWFIAGTLPKGTIGGRFEIILKAEKGQAIKIARYQ